MITPFWLYHWFRLVAVEYNGSIVPKNQYEEKILTDGDVIEVVSFVGGGWFEYKN